MKTSLLALGNILLSLQQEIYDLAHIFLQLLIQWHIFILFSSLSDELD